MLRDFSLYLLLIQHMKKDTALVLWYLMECADKKEDHRQRELDDWGTPQWESWSRHKLIEDLQINERVLSFSIKQLKQLKLLQIKRSHKKNIKFHLFPEQLEVLLNFQKKGKE